MGDQFVAQRRNRLLLQQRIARRGDHDRIENDVPDRVRGQRPPYGADEFRRVQHPDLDGVGADVVQHRPDLPRDKLDRHGMNTRNTHRVLIYNSHDGRCAEAAAGRKGLQIGLDPCTAAGVAARDGQGAFVAFYTLVVHIFHCSSCHALSQKSHSMRVQRTKMSVMALRVSVPARSASSSQMATARDVAAANEGSP